MTDSPASHLERLAASLLVLDPAARFTGRGDDVVTLFMHPTTVVLLRVTDVSLMQQKVKAVLAAVARTESLAFVIIDEVTTAGDTGAVLAELVPRSWSPIAAKRFASVWRPGSPVKFVRGVRWRVLENAIARLESGVDDSSAAVLEERVAQGDEVARFMQPLLARKPVVTWAIAGLSVALFALQMFFGSGEPYLSATRMGGSVKSLILHGEYWRLLSPMLLHGSIAHLGLNMWALVSFGGFLEQLLGPRRYLILYVASGLGGSIASALRPDEVLSVGASGGIWGLMIAGAVLVTWPRGRLPALVSAGQRQRAWVPVVINAAYSFQPGIDFLAHIGGGVVGGLLMFSGVLTAGLPFASEVLTGDPAGRDGRLIRVIAAVLGVALLGSITAAIVTGRPWELRARPALERVQIDDAWSIELPRFVTPRNDAAHEHVFGSLRYDPMTVVADFQAEPLTDDQSANLRDVLTGSVNELKRDPWPGFQFTTPLEVRDHDGRPYLFSEQTAEGRRARAYWLADGNQLVELTVVLNDEASEGWKSVAAQLPFTLSRAR